MPVIDCYMTGCTFATPNLDNAVAAVILSHHLSSAHPAPAQPKAPSIPPPSISGGIYEDQYDSFKRNWDSYYRIHNKRAPPVSIFGKNILATPFILTPPIYNFWVFKF